MMRPDGEGATGVTSGPTLGVLGYLEIGLATAAAAVTSLLYGNAFATRGYLVPALAAAAGGAVLAGLAGVRRWRSIPTALVAVLGFVVVATFTVFSGTLNHGVPTLGTASALGSGLLDGWARMLTAGLPADPTGELLVMPALLTWTASFLSTTLVLRSRVVLIPVLPPLMAFVAGLLLTAGRPARGLPLAAAFLLAVLLLVLVRVVRTDTTDSVDAAPEAVNPQPASGQMRTAAGRTVFGLPVVLAVALLGALGAAAIPVATGTERFDLRDVVPLQLTIDDTLTPLVTIKSQLRDPPRRLFTVRVGNDSTSARLDRVRTAALNDFDGALWTSDDSFLVAGHILPADPNLTNARLATIHVTVQNLDGPYLPALGWPVRVNATGVGFSSTSGVLVTNAATGRGMTYDVTAEVTLKDPKDKGLRSAVPYLPNGSHRYTQLPLGLPPEMQAAGTRLAGTVGTPFAKLDAIARYLRKLPYSLEARPGHSYDALRRLFSSNPQDRVGYAEQYAAAFAVLARSQGFPSRVAVGYLLRPAELSGRTYSVTSNDVFAWAEVSLAGYGWVPFDPVDPTRSITPRQPRTNPGTPPADKPGNPPNPGSEPVEDPNLTAVPGSGGPLGGTTALVVLAALLGALPVLVAVEKIRRRRQRRNGSRAAQIVGAWREATDRLVEHGVGVTTSLTAQEVALRAESELGEAAGAVAVLAPLVTRAVFCPEEPAEDAVREAWELDAQLRRDLRRGRNPLGTVRAWFDPRPLWTGWRDARRRGQVMERLHGG